MIAGTLETQFTANLDALRKGMAQAERELNAFYKRVGRGGNIPFGPFSSGGGSSPAIPKPVKLPEHNMPPSDALEKHVKLLDDLRAKYNPLFAAQRQYENNVQEITRALQLGAISQEEFNQATMQANASYNLQVAGINASSNALNKFGGEAALSTQQLTNLQYQFQDIGVMLASGQNPFVMIMQQGSQIVQMFKPGTGVGAAIKQIGSGFVTFLTNPLNVALLSLATLTVAVPALWDAVVGGGEKSNSVLENHSTWLDEILIGYDDLRSKASEGFEAAGKLPMELARLDVGKGIADITKEIENLQWQLEKPIREDAFLPLDNINEGLQLIREYKSQLDDGTMTAETFAEKMRRIQLNPNANSEVRRIAGSLADAALQQLKLNNQLRVANELLASMGPAAQRAAAQVQVLSQSFQLLQGQLQNGALVGPMDAITAISNQVQSLQDRIPEARTQLQIMRDDLNAILNDPLALPAQKTAAQEAFDQFARNTKIIEDRANALKGADERLKQAAQNQIFLADLQREVDILGLGRAERERMLKVLEQEREVRSAIESLGPNATAAEIALVQQLIPLRMQLNEQIRIQEEEIQNQISLYGEYGNAIGTALGSVISGAESAEKALAKMVVQIVQAIIQAQIMNTIGKTQPGIGSMFSNIIGGIFGGMRALGGPVEPGMMYKVNESTPNSEYFMPTQPGVIVPNRSVLQPANSSGGTININGQFEVVNGNIVPLISEVSGQVAGQAVRQSEQTQGARNMKQRMNRVPGMR